MNEHSEQQSGGGISLWHMLEALSSATVLSGALGAANATAADLRDWMVALACGVALAIASSSLLWWLGARVDSYIERVPVRAECAAKSLYYATFAWLPLSIWLSLTVVARLVEAT